MRDSDRCWRSQPRRLTDPDYPVLNHERVLLLDIDQRGGLTETGKQRLAYLNGYADGHTALVAPRETIKTESGQ